MKKLGTFIPIFLTIVLTLSIVPSAFAAQWLYYDDDSFEWWSAQPQGYYLAVKFSLPPGWGSAIIKRVSFAIHSESILASFKVHIFSSDGCTELLTPAPTVTPTTKPAWFIVDVTDTTVSGDFYVAIEYMDPNIQPKIGAEDNAPISGRSYFGQPCSGWNLHDERDFMIRAEVEEYEEDPEYEEVNPVGGIVYSADKISLLTPWIATLSIIGCIAIVSIVVKKRKNSLSHS